MKKIMIVLAIVITAIACTGPVHVTGKTDPQTATSGTQGSAKMETTPPPRPDSTKVDSLKLIPRHG